MILGLVKEAVDAGAAASQACAVLGLSHRTVERWHKGNGGDDRRHGPKTQPKNQLSARERQRVLEVVNAPAYRDLSPHQIVPRLADQGRYLASEATIFRLLRAAGQLTHRGRAKAPTKAPIEEHVATAPNQLWSWDITYLKTPVRGRYLYLYLMLDVFSRRIMGWEVHEAESPELAAALFRATCHKASLDPKNLVLRSDNGGPMRGSTMRATLEQLGVIASFSRPGTSSDNPFSEALFRTLKYRPDYPVPFETREQARSWVERFVTWYNHEHRHSALRFVTPEERYSGREEAILAARRCVYEQARRRRPERWSGELRNWTPVGAVRLGPRKPGERDRSSPLEVIAA